MTIEPGVSPPRSPGRPRSRAADEAILVAALDLLIERGMSATSIEQIARRAGVTRATVYRRFPNLTDLLVHAIEWEYQDTDPAALSWPDIPSMVRDWAGQLSEPRSRRLVRRLYGTVDDLPELLHTYHSAHGSHRGHAVRNTLERARATGQLPPHSDPETLQLVLSGAALQHLAAYPDTTEAKDIEAYFLAVLHQVGFPVTPPSSPSPRPTASRRSAQQ
ncbi:TetR family transcriptional regulator [Streptomyces spiroverticillatus]|uniref:TetR family transcriptional regulator n=1 Tax=Streptomyces finlayi TaxID=67296 RepID=A0A918WWE1_9ACTN|nr:TetR/AcrR family transcriptional regulator [Streptomyces finlayi]GHA07490.1 TetR family transcriptional regulator [Streptomyces spiroverticillatus]GHC90834.1 TetR family transcriptional regulator [Streptomyces finlayi]